jgi:DNA-binding NtrC family response regulator
LVAVFRGGAKTLRVVDGAVLVVGRAFPSDFVVEDASLSRQHARVRVERHALFVEDLGSTNGVWQAGRRVQSTSVRPGETVLLGDVTLMLEASAPRVRGVDGYDAFVHWLDQELLRARTFGRSLALISVACVGGGRPETTQASLIGEWMRLGERLRPVDRMGLYAANEMLIGLAEAGATEADAFVRALPSALPIKRVQYALFPRDGTSVEALLDAARKGVAAPFRPNEAHDAKPATPDIAAAHPGFDRVAQSQLSVLILGETGSGKERLARAVHDRSTRAHKPFVAFNCASVPTSLVESVLFGHERGAFTGAEKTTRGIFEQAHEGTLFLDEVGELGAGVQAALLRVLETKRYMRVGGDKDLPADVRIVAATHRDLEEMTSTGAFRQDLLFRLEGSVFRVAPLRERREEIGSLAASFLAEAARVEDVPVRRVGRAALAALCAYAWPGNVRELRNAMFRAAVVATADAIEPEDLPERVRRATSAGPSHQPPRAAVEDEPPVAVSASVPSDAEMPYKDRVRISLEQVERALITDALRDAGWNQTRAAERLKMPVRTLAHKMKELGIRRPG